MTTAPPGPVQRWVLAARPRTLPAAIVPVVVGASAVRPHSINCVNTLACAIIALALQIGTNFANDYSDGVRGTDEVRVGPFRLTASRLVPAARVRTAAFATFGAAAVVGVFLSSRTSWWMIAVGATAIAAGWFYTGGPRPYGYYGFGEFFVLVYFGFVATVGSAYVQHESIPARSWWLALSVGGAACALLEANNLRDVDGDRAAGKKTIAARLGRERASWLVVVCVVAIVVGGAFGSYWLSGLIALAIYVPAIRFAFSSQRGRELLPLLALSARAQLLLGVILSATCWIVHP